MEESTTQNVKFMTFSEAYQNHCENKNITTLVQWVKGYLASPHANLGRKGTVCPFVPTSLKMDSIWIAEVNDSNISVDKICEYIASFRDLFNVTEPIAKPNSVYKAFIIAFSSVRAGDEDLIVKVHRLMRMSCINMGLMLGEFHPEHHGTGLHNAEFRPLRSPFPILVIRRMIDVDLPLLFQSTHSVSERISILTAYLTNLRSDLNDKQFKQVLHEIIELEVEVNTNLKPPTIHQEITAE